MQHQIQPETPADSDSDAPVFEPAPDLRRDPVEGLAGVPVQPLSPAVAEQIEAQLRGIDNVTIRVLGDDPATGRDVAAHLMAKGYAVEVTLAERMIPPPLSRHVFRFQGRTAILTIAPDLP